MIDQSKDSSRIILGNITPELQKLFLKKIQEMYDNKELHGISSIDRTGLAYSQKWIKLEESRTQEVNHCSYCHRILENQQVTDLDSEFCNARHKKEYFISMELDEQT